MLSAQFVSHYLIATFYILVCQVCVCVQISRASDSGVVTRVIQLDDRPCSQDILLDEVGQKIQLELQTEECDNCSHSCSSPVFCKFKVSLANGYLKHGFEVCVDMANVELDDCRKLITLSHGGLYNAITMMCVKPFTGTVKCSDDFVLTEIMSGINGCGISGYLLVYLQRKKSTFDLSARDGDCSDGKAYTSSASGQIVSRYRSASQDTPHFCELELSPFYGKNELCLTFKRENFVSGGAKLIIKDLTNHASTKEIAYESTSHKFSNCFKTGESTGRIKLYVAPGFAAGDLKYKHEFAVSYSWKDSYTNSWWDNTNSDSDDNYSYGNGDDGDGTSQFQKKILIAMAVICVALFLCCYYGCSKAKKTNGSTQYQEDPGLGNDVTRTPFYGEGEALTGENSNGVRTYVNSTGTVRIDAPVQPGQQTNGYALYPTTTAMDQPPPQYADLTPPQTPAGPTAHYAPLAPYAPPAPYAPQAPSVPPAPSGQHGPGSTQASVAVSSPPAYDSLFPDH